VLPLHWHSFLFLKALDLRRFEEDMEEGEEKGKKGVGSKVGEGCCWEGRLGGAEKAAHDDADRISLGDKMLKRSELSPAEITRVLRSLGLPVRLFGERTVVVDGERNAYDDSEREERLNTARELTSQAMAGMAENDEFRLVSGHGIRNPFLGGKRNQNSQTMPGLHPPSLQTLQIKKTRASSHESPASHRQPLRGRGIR